MIFRHVRPQVTQLLSLSRFLSHFLCASVSNPYPCRLSMWRETKNKLKSLIANSSSHSVFTISAFRPPLTLVHHPSPRPSYTRHFHIFFVFFVLVFVFCSIPYYSICGIRMEQMEIDWRHNSTNVSTAIVANLVCLCMQHCMLFTYRWLDLDWNFFDTTHTISSVLQCKHCKQFINKLRTMR